MRAPLRFALLWLAALVLTACSQTAPPPQAPQADLSPQALVWTIRTLDADGALGTSSSLALDGGGNPVISYYGGSHVKLYRCFDITCNTGVANEVDTNGINGFFSSLALDGGGNPVISYSADIDSQGQLSGDLQLVHCGNATCTGGSTFQTVDSGGADAVGYMSSLVLDSSGNPVISHYDFTNKDLKFVRCGDSVCGSGNTLRTLDSLGDTGRYTSLALDSSGIPAVSYYDATNGDLRLYRCFDTTCSSGTATSVDVAGDVGTFTSLALDGSGNPVISYIDATNADLKLVHCGDARCSSGNSVVTLDSAGTISEATSLELDGSGRPVVSYYDATNGDLKLVQCGNANCTSGNTIQVVDSADNVGTWSSLELDATGKPVISYQARVTNGDLKIARLVETDTTPPTVTLEQAAGQPDPTDASPISFTAVFSEPVTGFAASDVTLGGTAGATNASVTGDGTTFLILVSGVTGDGTVTASIAANVVTDLAGNPNAASSSTDNTVTYIAPVVDSTPPVITPTVSGTLGDNGWYISDVTVSWSVVDAESAITSQSGCDATTLSSDTAGTTLTCTAESAGGTSTQSVTVKRDATAPTLAPSVSPNPVLLNGSATATPNASDATSGVASQLCEAVDTSSVGDKTVNCSATDNAGNSATAYASYKVVYAFEGFFRPVENLPTFNLVKAGQTIPLKWRLTDANGMPVTSLSTLQVSVTDLNCSSGSSSGATQLYASGSSGLQNLGDGYYQFNWKTPKSYADTCKTVQLDLSEGVIHTALFKFKK